VTRRLAAGLRLERPSAIVRGVGRQGDMQTAVLPWILVSCALAASCSFGHPASREECEELFTRNAEIELRSQNIQDKAVIEKRTADARAAKGAEFQAQCMGKRITDAALGCVRKARTAIEFDKCLD
jgi:hypothetical protein